MNYIPGKRIIKKYLYRLLVGIPLLPLGPVILFFNEWTFLNATVPAAIQEIPGSVWFIRIASVGFIIYCIYLILSGIKLFMNQIPLSYHDIRTGLWITSLLVGTLIGCLSMSMVWLIHYPIMSVVPLGIALVSVLGLLMKGRSRRKQPAATKPNQPHQPTDV